MNKGVEAKKIYIRKIKERKGITLIALVITIIILLILTGITISQLSQNGLFNKAKEAEELSKQRTREEQNRLNEYSEYIDDIENNKHDLDETNKDKDIYKDNMVFLEHFDDVKYKFGNAAAYINNTFISYPLKEEYRLDKDFTIDYWVYESSDNTGMYNSHIVSSVAGGIWIGLYNEQYAIVITGVGNLICIDEKPQNNEWTHVAICRKNNNLSIYFNGKLKGSVQTDYVFQPGVITIGYDIYNGGFYSKNIYIDEVRILNGVAQWEDEFTPPNSEYNDNDPQVVFLDHLNKIPDNALDVTAKIGSNKSKFGKSSLYINDNYVSYPSKEEYRLDKDFTIDYWVYESSDNTGMYNSHIVSSVAGGIWIGLYYEKYVIGITGVGHLICIDEKPQNNEWTHVAICRKNNNLSIYFNGKLKGSVQTDYVFQPGVITIGYDIYNGGFYSKNIYIDEVRILNGVVAWKENFTPFTKAYN